MPGKTYANMDEDELIKAQIAVSNRRAEGESKLKEEGLEIQGAINNLRLTKKFENLSEGEKAALRDMLATEESE